MTRPFLHLLSLCALLALPGMAAAKELVVVQVAPLSGPQAVTGKAIGAGAKLYFDHVNAQGGINGMQIRLTSRDDMQKPEETVRLVKESLRNDEPVAFIGTVGTNNVEALIRDGSLGRSGTPLIGAVSGASSLIGAPGVFVVKASYRDETEALFARLAPLGQKKVGVVFQDDALGKDVLAGVDAAAGKHGVELVARAGYERNTTKIETAVDAMLKANPQAILLGATTAAAIEFVRLYRQRGGLSTLYGLSIIDTQQLLAKVGAGTARGYAFSVVVPQEMQTLPLNREYSKLKAAANNPELSARSIEGYIAARVLVSALRQGATSGPAVNKAVSGMRKLDLGGYLLDFSSLQRTGSNYVDFAMFGEGGRVYQ
ncbi:MAG TPA: ABC transporter substrate-binding protein [Azonexus sp.]|nr:ABC transporter substrate-binding protein [Azonexus sp.]